MAAHAAPAVITHLNPVNSPTTAEVTKGPVFLQANKPELKGSVFCASRMAYVMEPGLGDAFPTLVSLILASAWASVFSSLKWGLHSFLSEGYSDITLG